MAKTADRMEHPGKPTKQVGRQLRQVRRKQGLSRGDVARSAGLTRRELAAYERGRVEVPDSDLWCLAGSCGVDVTELLPEREPLKVGADLSSLSIGDSMRYLRGPAEPDGLLHEYLSMIYELRNLPPGSRVPLREPDLIALADALGGTPEAIERRLHELVGASDEEASRLRAMILPPLSLQSGKPVPKTDPAADFAARDEAANDFFSMPRAADPFLPPPAPGTAPLSDAPAPPFDPYAALAATVDDSYETDDAARAAPLPADVTPAPETVLPDPFGADVTPAPETVLPDPFGADVTPAPETVLPDPFAASPAPPLAWTEPDVPEAAAAPGTPQTLPPLRSDPFAPGEPLDVVPPDVSVPEPAPQPAQWQPPVSPRADEVDWSPSVESTPAGDAGAFEPLVVDVPDLVEEMPPPLAYRAPDAAVNEINWASQVAEPVFAPEPAYAPEPVRTSSPVAYAPSTTEYAPTEPAAYAPPQFDRAPAPTGHYQQAGSAWHVGGMFPATATADGGGLALRRADARWALADLVAPGDFTLEALFDFRSGAGFGILFRASIDDSERLTAYSFDIDTIAADGSFLLRQWDLGQQTWQPLAQVPAGDAARLYGRHTLMIGLYGDRLTVTLDGESRLDMDELARCSIDHGRAPCRGAQVGVQASATTEVTIESFRLAQH